MNTCTMKAIHMCRGYLYLKEHHLPCSMCKSGPFAVGFASRCAGAKANKLAEKMAPRMDGAIDGGRQQG